MFRTEASLNQPQDQAAWSFSAALLVSIAPLLGAGAAAWIELREPGETAMWLVAAACFLVAPGVAAAACERTASPTAVRRFGALLLAAALYGIWVTNVPVRTHPGVYAAGESSLSGAVMAMVTALGWYVATWRALAWRRMGHAILGSIFGGADFAFVGAVAFVAGSVTP